MKPPEETEQFVGLENELRLAGPSVAKLFLFRRIGFENYHSSLFQALFYPGNQAAVEEIKIENKVIPPRGKAISIQIRGHRLDFDSPCPGPFAGPAYGNRGDINGLNLKAVFRQENGVPSFAGGQIEGLALGQRA